MSDDNGLLDGKADPITDDPLLSEQIAELKRENQQAPAWLPLVIIGAVAWAALGIWLSNLAHWPGGYGYNFDCVYRACVIVSMIYSPALLNHPTFYSLALFAWYAAMAAFLLRAIVGAIRKSPGKALYLLALIAGALAVILLSPGGGAHD